MKTSYKRIAIWTGAVFLTLVVGSYGVYLFFADSIKSTLRTSVLTYVQERINTATHHVASNKLRVTLGNLDYTYLTGSVDLKDIRIEFNDSAGSSGEYLNVVIPEVRVRGVYPWDVINGGGLSIGTITVTDVRIDHRGSHVDSGTAEIDTSEFRLPRLPNVDSLIRKASIAALPANIKPLTIDGINLLNVTSVNTRVSRNGTNGYTGTIKGLNVRVGAITLGSDADLVRPIEYVHVDLQHWLRTYADSRRIHTRGFNISVSGVDSSLTVDSVDYFTPRGMTYSASHVRFSYRDARLLIGSFSLGPTPSDREYLDAQKYNTDRFRVQGENVLFDRVDFPALSAGDALHMRSLSVDKLHLDILSNKLKKPNPSVTRPAMPNEMMRSVPFAIIIDSVKVRSASISYGERWPHSSTPATLRWKNIQVAASSLSNATGAAPFVLSAKGTFQDQATMQATFTIPLLAPVYRLDAAGSLTRLDITSLNSFLPVAENVRIRKGIASEARFRYTVRGRVCTGEVAPRYQDLKVDLLDKRTKKSNGVLNSIISFVANTFIIKSYNDGDDYAPGKISYTLPADAAVMQTIWFPVRAGLTKAAGL